MIDLHTGVPLYRQLKDALRGGIISGQWSEGSQIPTESELCKTYRVSRITVRQALDDLVTEGWLYRRQGKGTFVRAMKREVEMTPFFFLSQGQAAFPTRHTHLPVRRGVIPATQVVQAALQTGPGEQVYEIVRIRMNDQGPVALEVGYLPRVLMRRFPRQSEIRDDYFYDILRRCTGRIPARTRVTLEPTLLAKAAAEVLGAPVGSPALHLERLTTDVDGRPVLMTRNIIGGAQGRYVFDHVVPVALSHLPTAASDSDRRRKEG